MSTSSMSDTVQASSLIRTVKQTVPRRTAYVTWPATAFLVASDFIAFAVAIVGARLLAPEGWAVPGSGANSGVVLLNANWHVWGSGLLFLTLAVIFQCRGHYTQRVPFWSESAQVVTTVMIGLFVLSLAKVTLDAEPLRLWMMVAWLAFIPLILLGRAVTKFALARTGQWTVATVIVGKRGNIVDVEAALQSQRDLGYDIVACFTPDEFYAAVKEVGLAAALATVGAMFVIVVLDAREDAGEQHLVRLLDRARLTYAVVPNVRALPVAGLNPHYFIGHDVMMLLAGDNSTRPFARAAKSAFDFVTAGIGMLLISPILVVIAVLVTLDGGPALFAHERIGANGRRFPCYKFRSMVMDADRRLSELLAANPEAAAEWQEKHKLRADPRITWIGRILRATSLDELPQLFNVLRGEMSLVGPRPIVDAEVLRYAENFAYYLEVRPGLTGLWQVSGRSDTSYEDRVRLDVWYVRNWSLWHDVAILMKTVPAVLRRRGSA
jgi:Undecaprenyl-phosphate galactose phosphotransferase WbaP